MLVFNRHASHVAGVPPGHTAEVADDTAARFRWALRPVERPAEGESAAEGERPAAREAIETIRASNSAEFVRGYLGDSRSSVHAAAVRRLRQISE